MKGSTHIHWFRGILALAVVVAAGVMVTTAGAVGRPPDVQDAARVAPQHVTIPAWLSRIHYPGTSYEFNLVSADDVSTPPDVMDVAKFQNSTPAGVQADGLRLQGEAQAYQQVESSNGPTALGQQADGLRLQAMAQAYRDQSNPGGNYPATYDVGGQQVQPTGQGNPDVFERYAAAHPFGQGLSQVSSVVNRPPDVTDAAQSIETASVSSSSGFEWSDWGIGIGTGVGIALLLGAGLMAGRGLRHRSIQTA
jgi:hypothetical protein